MRRLRQYLKTLLPLDTLAEFPAHISPFLRSTCCEAPVCFLWDVATFRNYVACVSCGRDIDFADEEIAEIIRRMADEFIITKPIYNIQDPLYPRGTLAERRAYWATETYSYFLHERLKSDLRNPMWWVKSN